MVVFQALTWEARDEDDEHKVSIFGKTAEGSSVCVTTTFAPYFFVKLPRGTTQQSVKLLYNELNRLRKDLITSYSITEQKDVWGFQNNETFFFMHLTFKTLEARRKVNSVFMYNDDYRQYRVYESNIDPVLRLMHRTGIQSTGWLDTGDACVRSHLANVDVDLWCNDWKTLRPVDRDDIAPFIVASFDIECNSSTGKFPDANVPGDACFQIAISLCTFGSDEPYEKTCLCYKKTEGPGVQSFETERDMLLAFHAYVHEKDIDILTGWNIFGFDLDYVYKRAAMVGCGVDFYTLGKLKGVESHLVEKKLSSSALGDNVLKLLPMPGRFVFDMFHEIKRGYKLDSYSLNNVSKQYIGDQKIDMAPKEMFARYEEGDPHKLGEVAEYCIKDTLLPHKIMKKLCTLLNLLEMAKATWVPLCFLVERGQQIKVFSQLTKKARELGYMVPTIRYGSLPEEPYEGATVLDAQKGAYYTPITALDFEALYPSIMMAHNLCYSTYVMDEKRYGNIPGVTYETFTVGEKTYTFAQDVPSLLPSILAELKQFRKKAKKDMATATGAMKDVYNGKQLAYKVSMNSVYGFTGAGKGILPCVPIASTTTCRGRGMIEETKTYVEAHFPGAKVRYGDSVTPDTPLLIRGRDGKVRTVRIDSLVDTYDTRDDGKETGATDGLEVWTEKGFTPIQQVVRHKTSKEIYRVMTARGMVDVTADHSLLRDTTEMIRPTDLVPGKTRLLHGNCVEAASREDTSVSVNEARALGHCFDGTVVPPCVLNAESDAVVEAYLEGVGTRLPDTKEGALGLYVLMRRTGRRPVGDTTVTSVRSFGTTNGYVYDLTTGSHHFHVGPGDLVVHNTDSVMVEFDVGGRTGEEAIQHSWELGERAARECSALFKKPNNLELEKVYWPYFLYSKKRYAAKLWTKGKDGQMHMDYVDVKGLQLVRRDNTPHVREVCKELLDVVLGSSDPGPPKVLARQRALELLSGEVSNEKLILSQGLSDTYKVDGKNVSATGPESTRINQAHVQVVNKMRLRKPGSEPQSGDRVPYLLTVTNNPNAKAFEKSEDPAYVEEHGVPVDYRYYFMNKFLNPVCDLLEPLFENTKQEIFGDIMPAPKQAREQALSTMKKDQLVETCKKMDLDASGTMTELRSRIKGKREKQNSVEDLFKNYARGLTKSS